MAYSSRPYVNFGPLPKYYIKRFCVNESHVLFDDFTYPTQSYYAESGTHEFPDDAREGVRGGVVSVEIGAVPVSDSGHDDPVDVLEDVAPGFSRLWRVFGQEVPKVTRLDVGKNWPGNNRRFFLIIINL